MIIRQWGLAWLAGAAAIAATGPASAETTRVELRLSGPTWHAAACPHENPFGTARCHARIVTDARGTPIDGKARANRGGTPNAIPAGYGPADLKAAYAIPAGSGAPVIAIVDAYGYAKAESDLAVYRSQYGLPSCTTANGCFKKVSQTGGTNYPRDNIGWAQEQALDLDMASAACPNCKIVLVQAKSASFSDLMAAVSYAKTIPGIRAISNSYGGTDSTSMAQYDSVYSGNNIAITASTGDSGYGAQYPATSSGVIAVGGTSLSRGGSGFSESAWSGAGSGCGLGHSKPNWQGGVTDACAGRMEADISAVADPNTGVAVYGPRNSFQLRLDDLWRYERVGPAGRRDVRASQWQHQRRILDLREQVGAA